MIGNINLTPIIQALITLFAAIVTCVVVPWIKAKCNNEQKAAMRAFVKTLVYAAEQIYGEGNGAMKKKYVENKLAKAGYDVDVDEIEAAVAQAFNFVSQATFDIELDEPDKLTK